MRIKAALAAIILTIALAPVVYPETTSAAPKCGKGVPNCRRTQDMSRADVKALCEATNGIDTGTTATTDGYGCYGTTDDDDSFVECDSKGECIAGGKGRRAGVKGPRRESPTAPARR